LASRSTGLLVRPGRRRVGLAPPSESWRLRSRIREMVGRAWRWGVLRRSRRPGAPAFWSAFGGPASHHRRGRAGANGEGCDPADVAPAASLVAWTAAPGRSAARVARQRHCVEPTTLPEGCCGTMACPARPGERCFPRAFNGAGTRIASAMAMIAALLTVTAIDPTARLRRLIACSHE